MMRYGAFAVCCVLHSVMCEEVAQIEEMKTEETEIVAVLGDERVVMNITDFGQIEMGFYPEATPYTAAHMLNCFKMGLFDSNNVFRVDKGFVAQVADALGGRRLPMNETQQALAKQNVKGEFPKMTAKHVRGALSMGKWEAPDSGTHSFSMFLGTHPGLDQKYAIFGKVTKGFEVLDKLETVETKKEGIFVMPKQRIEIFNTWIYKVSEQGEKAVENEAEVKEAKQEEQKAEENAEHKAEEKVEEKVVEEVKVEEKKESSSSSANMVQLDTTEHKAEDKDTSSTEAKKVITEAFDVKPLEAIHTKDTSAHFTPRLTYLPIIVLAGTVAVVCMLFTTRNKSLKSL